MFAYAAVFVLSGLVYAFVEAVPRFRDPDSFYHVKIATLIREHGIVHSFSWLPFTTLAEKYADHHFLYHLLLIPFVTALGPFIGMTVATIFFAALTITIFFFLLRVYEVRYAWLYTAILATSGAFIFRLNLAKTSALSITMLFLALIASKKNKPLVLFVIAWLYVLLYGGWPILIVVMGAFVLARATADHIVDQHPFHSWACLFFWKRLLRGSRSARSDFFASTEVRNLGVTIAGLFCGVIINPYFPTNISFYWNQIVQIALIGYRGSIGVGGEWYPYNLDRLFLESSGIFLLAAIVLTGFIIVFFWPELLRRLHQKSAEEMIPLIASGILSVAFLIMSLRSKRHVEYFAPFTMFSVALLFNALLYRLSIRTMLRKLFDLCSRGLIFVAGTVLILVFIFISARDVFAVRALYKEGVPWQQYAGATKWLAAHAPKDAVVFHSNWDEFPILFFADDQQRYIVGLDPTFFYLHDSVRYALWVDVTTGKVPRGAASLVRRMFGANLVFIANGHEQMLHAFEKDPNAIVVYKDADAEIFAIL